MGEAGIGTLGYNFSIAGVGGRVSGPFARGAESVGMEAPSTRPFQRTVWNMIYDQLAPQAFYLLSHSRAMEPLSAFLKKSCRRRASGVARFASRRPPHPTMRQQPASSISKP